MWPPPITRWTLILVTPHLESVVMIQDEAMPRVVVSEVTVVQELACDELAEASGAI